MAVLLGPLEDIVNLRVNQYANYDETVTFLTSNGSAPRDLNEFEVAELEIRDEGDTQYLAISLAGGGIVLGGSSGTAQILMTDTETGALPLNTRLYYDLRVQNTLTSVWERLMSGRVYVSRGISRT